MLSTDECARVQMILNALTPMEFKVLKQHFENRESSTKVIRSTFTAEEDAIIQAMVQQYGTKNWNRVAQCLPGRTSRQCRERYRHYLSPSINNSEWTDEEDRILLQKFDEYGPKWVAISNCLKNRTDISVKNRWIVLMRRNNMPKKENKINAKAFILPNIREVVATSMPPISTYEFDFNEFTEDFDVLSETIEAHPFEI